MNDKNFMALIALIIVAVAGSVIFFGKNDSSGGGNWTGDPLRIVEAAETNEAGDITQAADHIIGPKDAKVTLIEFADFECSACEIFYPQLKALEAAYPDDLQVVFRHNPLTQIHPNAFAAHRASVAAANQEMFWEMHDLLYERQTSWNRQNAGLDTAQATDVIVSFAEELNLDIDKFREDIESEDTFNFIDSHLDSGAQLNVTGTPTIYLNGELVAERSFEELSAIIDGILSNDSEAGESVDQDTPQHDN